MQHLMQDQNTYCVAQKVCYEGQRDNLTVMEDLFRFSKYRL